MSENPTLTGYRESPQQLETSNLQQFNPEFDPYESNWQSATSRNRIPDHSTSPRRHWITDPRFSNANYDHVFSIWVNDQEILESNEDDQVPDLELPPPSYSQIEDINALPPPSYEVAFQNEVEQIKHITVISKKLRSHLWKTTLV